jgi:hypothetical protein
MQFSVRELLGRADALFNDTEAFRATEEFAEKFKVICDQADAIDAHIATLQSLNSLLEHEKAEQAAQYRAWHKMHADQVLVLEAREQQVRKFCVRRGGVEMNENESKR